MKMTKQGILYEMQMNGYHIDDIFVDDGKPVVGRRCSDGTMIWNSLDLEGNKFRYLFQDDIEKWMEKQ